MNLDEFVEQMKKEVVKSHRNMDFCRVTRRSRRMLKNDALVAKIGAGTAENEPPKGSDKRTLDRTPLVILAADERTNRIDPVLHCSGR